MCCLALPSSSASCRALHTHTDSLRLPPPPVSLPAPCCSSRAPAPPPPRCAAAQRAGQAPGQHTGSQQHASQPPQHLRPCAPVAAGGQVHKDSAGKPALWHSGCRDLPRVYVRPALLVFAGQADLVGDGRCHRCHPVHGQHVMRPPAAHTVLPAPPCVARPARPVTRPLCLPNIRSALFFLSAPHLSSTWVAACFSPPDERIELHTPTLFPLRSARGPCPSHMHACCTCLN